MYPTFLMSLLLFLGPVTVVEPRYPPDAVAGGTVIAVVGTVDGAVQKVDLLYSDPPFASSVQSALARWHFESAGFQETLVIVHFRHPQTYLLGPAKQEIPLRKHKEFLPYPISIIQPANPINIIGEVSVIFYADITENGNVSNVQIVQSPGNLTVGLDTVKKWEFLPARKGTGERVPSHAYIVLVFRPPVTTPGPTHEGP